MTKFPLHRYYIHCAFQILLSEGAQNQCDIISIIFILLLFKKILTKKDVSNNEEALKKTDSGLDRKVSKSRYRQKYSFIFMQIGLSWLFWNICPCHMVFHREIQWNFWRVFNDAIYHGNNEEAFKKTDSGLDREVRKKSCMWCGGIFFFKTNS